MTTINELAAQMTIEQLGWPTMDEIIKAKKLMDVYEKNVQRIKGDNRLKRKQREYRVWLSKEKEEHPDKCFCEKDGIGVHRGYEEDGIIGYFTTFGYYDYYQQHPIDEPWYKCSNCGKKYCIQVAIA